MDTPNRRLRDAAIAALALTLATVGLPATASGQTAGPSHALGGAGI